MTIGSLEEIITSSRLLAILLALSLWIWWRPLSTTMSLAATNEAYTHILMVVPLSLALTYMWRTTPPVPMSPSRGAGSALLALGLLISAVASLDHALPEGFGLSLSLKMLALIVWWFGCVVICYGTNTFRSLLFPLCFLLWL